MTPPIPRDRHISTGSKWFIGVLLACPLTFFVLAGIFIHSQSAGGNQALPESDSIFHHRHPRSTMTPAEFRQSLADQGFSCGRGWNQQSAPHASPAVGSSDLDALAASLSRGEADYDDEATIFAQAFKRGYGESSHLPVSAR